MKKLLLGLTLLASMSSFAETACLNNNEEVCFDVVGSQNSESLSITYFNYLSGNREDLSRNSMCKELLGVKYRSSFVQRIMEKVDLACVR